jgi:DNA-binding beta-propeller fold protein YncE
MIRTGAFPIRRFHFVYLALLLILASLTQSGAQPRLSGGRAQPYPDAPTNDKVYESSYRDGIVEIFNSRGMFEGLLAKVVHPTGLVFDPAGNLYVASNHRSNFSIKKILVDGTVTTFADSTLLDGPHGLALDSRGNLYVANSAGDSIVKFTPAGVGAFFADRHDGLTEPISLAFDAAGILYVSNANGGAPGSNGRVLKFTPDGVGSVFNETDFQSAYGLALDPDGNVYVSNNAGNTVEKFAPDGTDLGLFASSGLNAPLGIMFDRKGNLYVANEGNNTIERYSRNGIDLGVFATTHEGPHFLALLSSSTSEPED